MVRKKKSLLRLPKLRKRTKIRIVKVIKIKRERGLTREQIAQKLAERKARTQARIERARILRTPMRLR